MDTHQQQPRTTATNAELTVDAHTSGSVPRHAQSSSELTSADAPLSVGVTGSTEASWRAPTATTHAALIAVRNTELQAHWQRYNIQSVLNTGFMIAVIGSRDGSFVAQQPLIMAGVGVALSIQWLAFAIRSKNVLTRRWDWHIQQFEKKVGNRLSYPLFSEVAKEETKQGAPLTWLQRALPIAFGLGWILYGILNVTGAF